VSSLLLQERVHMFAAVKEGKSTYFARPNDPFRQVNNFLERTLKNNFAIIIQANNNGK